MMEKIKKLWNSGTKGKAIIVAAVFILMAIINAITTPSEKKLEARHQEAMAQVDNGEDIKSAIQLLTKNSKAGYPESQYQLALRLGSPSTMDIAALEKAKAECEGDIKRTIELIDRLEELVRTQGANSSALSYSKQDLIKYKDKLAKLNTAIAKASIKPDEKQAVKWLEKAADQGHPDAQMQLGRLYLEGGWGLKQKEKVGAKWLLRAAKQGNHDAAASLAFCYKDGTGVKQDVVEGYKWLIISGEEFIVRLFMGDESARPAGFKVNPFPDLLTDKEQKQARKMADAFKPKPE
jgi:TPR repeat protein